MDDVTSGFNFGTDISMLPQFNGIVGFTTEEVREMAGHYKAAGALPEEVGVDNLLEEIKPWYDNYCFSSRKTEEHLFNSDMTLYFLNSYVQQQMPPEIMVDNNIRTDYGKLRHLIQVDKQLGKTRVVLHVQLGQKYGIARRVGTHIPIFCRRAGTPEHRA